MLNESRSFLYFAPWFAVAPGVALTCFLVGLVLLSHGLRDVLDLGEDSGAGR
jgi:peptide/nickel transport system permease protein